MKIYLIRHGRTALNRRGVYIGWKDVGLDDRGSRQAKQVAKALNCGTDKSKLIYSSDLKRARETAQKVSEVCEIPLRTTPKLRELSFGRWEGKTYDQILEEDPTFYEGLQKDPVSFNPPEGETPKELKKRVLQTWLEMVAEEKDLAVVSHSGPIKIMLLECLCSSLSGFWKIKIDLGSISRIVVREGGPLVTAVNYSNHLEEEK